MMAQPAEDDWLRQVEETVDQVNAAVSNNNQNNPFRARQDQGSQPGSAESISQMQNTSTGLRRAEMTLEVGITNSNDVSKENINPANVNRRRRRLPSPGDQPGRMRKAMSLGNLPAATSNNDGNVFGRPRRRLPDPSQGKLIQQVVDKLDEEATLRLQVARELKEEKRKRWKAEDELSDLQASTSQLTSQLNEKREELNRVKQELDEERHARQKIEEQSIATEKEARRMKLDLKKLREQHSKVTSEATSSEDALQEAWHQIYEEKRKRQVAEDRLKMIADRILRTGGREILNQLLPEDHRAGFRTPDGAASPITPIVKHL